MVRIRIVGAAAFAAAMLAISVVPTSAQRTSWQSCRQGVLAIIHYLDNSEEQSADYTDAARAVIETCGRRTRAVQPDGAVAAGRRKECRALALKMLDELEEARVNTQVFARARDSFARRCGPG
jgi:hypothetical protein